MSQAWHVEPFTSDTIVYMRQYLGLSQRYPGKQAATMSAFSLAKNKVGKGSA